VGIIEEWRDIFEYSYDNFFGGFCFVLRNGGEDDEVAAMATFDFEEV
jgi:hypothetical protein